MLSKLWTFFILNLVIFCLHIYQFCDSVFYFFQLTVIGQTLVCLNFFLSIILHEQKSTLHTKLLLSRLHLITLALEGIVVVGYWGLRVFFSKGIMKDGEQRNLIIEFFSIYVHGGSFLTMFYFIKTDQIVSEISKRRKFLFHLGWGLPFLILQYLHWYLSGRHVYGFLKHFDWPQLIIFEASLYCLAVWIDYFLTLRHGYKLSLKHHHDHHEKPQQHTQ